MSERELLEKVVREQQETNDRLEGLQDSVDAQTAILQQVLQQILAAIGTEVTATSGTISQLGDSNMITGTKVGGTSQFQVVWNGGMTPGAAVVWTSNDPGLTITPVATDPTGNTVQVVDAVADTLTSYTLDVAGTASDGTAVKATTVTVPLLVAPATGGTVNQLS